MQTDLRGARVTVMGLGRFGGGLGVTRWLADQGGRVPVSDRLPADQLQSGLAALADLIETGQVTLDLGGHDPAALRDTDLLVVNPAVPRPWENPLLAPAREARVPITTEIRLVMERLPRDRVIGITGTAGKSTTSAMVHHALGVLGVRSHLGGNIGGSLLGRLAEIRSDDRIVLELSSAMLYWLDEGRGRPYAPGLSPGTAVLTHIRPNHLDWHGSEAHYRACKELIFRHQRSGDRAIRGMDVADGPADLLLPGAHNRLNAHLAAAAVEAATGIERERTLAALADFRGLPHRLQLVHEAGGRRYFDDSKSTTPEATAMAVAAFDDPSRVHLIAGGYDKRIDLTPIEQLAKRVARVYTIGDTGPRLADAIGERPCGTLDSAIDRARGAMRDGDVLLLSPGCASWDQFENYEARGRAFAALVQAQSR